MVDGSGQHLANVGQATDIVLLAMILALALVVGLALYAVDRVAEHFGRGGTDD